MEQSADEWGRDMLVSVLMPVYRSPWVGEAVADVLGQTWRDIELIAVHQGPRDDVLASLESVRDARFVLLRRDEPDTGAALELARSAARGEWLARMDADDRCAQHRLARQVDLSHDADVVACAATSFSAGSFPAGRERYVAWQNGLLDQDAMASERFVECPYLQGTALLRASAVAAAGGWRPGPQEDYDLALRLFEAGARHVKVPDILYRWRIHPGQSSRRVDGSASRAVKARHLRLPADAFVAGRGRSLRAWADLLRLPSFEIDPRRPLLPSSGFPVLVFGSASVRAALRASMAGRPHVFVA